MQVVQKMYEEMLRDQMTAAQQTADADPLDLAADLERMMVASGELAPYKSDEEMEATQTEAATQTEEPDAAAGRPQQQQQQDKEDRPSGGLLVNNP